jgi:trigger factor
MTVQFEKVSEIKKRLTVTVDAQTVGEEREKVLKTVRKQAHVRGFRPGKAPIGMIKQQYAEYIEEEVKRNLVGEAIGEAIENADVKIAEQPELEKAEFNDAGELEIVTLVETMPEVELGDYKGLEVEQERVRVLDQAVETRLEGLRQQHATLTEIDDRDVCEMGDHVRIDFIGRLAGEVFQGGSHEDHVLELGSSTFIPGFEEGLVGMKVGETKTVTVTFPEGDSRNDLAGKEIDFEVTAKAINRRDLPELDDEFAKDTDQGETIEELKQHIHDSIEEGEQERTKRAARRNLIDKLIELHPIEVPHGMVDRQLEYLVRSRKIEMAMAGMPIEHDPAADEQMKERLTGSATKEVQSYFILRAIADAEGLEVADEDVEARLVKIAERQERPVEEVSAHYQKENMIDSLKEEILDEKTVDFLLEHAKITWEEPPAASQEDEIVDAEIDTDGQPEGDENKE